MTKQSFIDSMSSMVLALTEKYGIKVVSPIIAQACLESNFGNSELSKIYNNFFGLKCGVSWKGKSVNLKTKEEYEGKITTIKDNFRAYNTPFEGVEGYFIFTSTKRYSNLKICTSPQSYLQTIKNDGYATDSKYVDKCMNIINQYNLTQYDSMSTNTLLNKDVTEDLDLVIADTINGKYGNGEKRKIELEKKGFNYKLVQTLVNRNIANGEKIAEDVRRGIYDNGNERKLRLREHGYSYTYIQSIVNKK